MTLFVSELDGPSVQKRIFFLTILSDVAGLWAHLLHCLVLWKCSSWEHTDLSVWDDGDQFTVTKSLLGIMPKWGIVTLSEGTLRLPWLNDIGLLGAKSFESDSSGKINMDIRHLLPYSIIHPYLKHLTCCQE